MSETARAPYLSKGAGGPEHPGRTTPLGGGVSDSGSCGPLTPSPSAREGARAGAGSGNTPYGTQPLRYHLRLAGKSGAWLARATTCPKRTVNGWIAGRTASTVRWMCAVADLLIYEGLDVDELSLFTPEFLVASMRRTAAGIGADYDGRPIGYGGMGGESTELRERAMASWIKAEGAARRILDECTTPEEIKAAMAEYNRLREVVA